MPLGPHCCVVARAMGVALLIVTVLFATTMPVSASRVRTVNLEQMTRKAGRIVVGRVARVESLRDETTGLPFVQVTLRVQRTSKGTPQDTIAFRMLGVGSESHWAGIPGFVRGEEVTLFLYPESRSGWTSPVGFSQGKFVTKRDKSGRLRAINGLGNRGLFGDLSESALQRLASSRTRVRSGLLAPDELVDIVEELRRGPPSDAR